MADTGLDPDAERGLKMLGQLAGLHLHDRADEMVDRIVRMSRDDLHLCVTAAAVMLPKFSA